MNGTQMTTSKDMNDLENMLASLTAAEAEETAASAAVADEELDDALLADLDAKIARAESYEKQDTTGDMSATAEPAKLAGKTKRASTKTSKTPSTGATARAPRKSLADLDEAAFEIIVGSPPIDKAAVIAARPKQVKIAEKFDNLFQALAASKLPSSYVVTAIKLLDSKNTMTSADLIATYKADGLGDGTARSQTGQIMELFNVVGIANRSGQSLTLLGDSAIFRKVKALIASNAQPAS